MISFRIVLAIFSLMSVSAVRARAVDFVINLKANKESMAEIHLKIEGDFATTTVAEMTEQFNLKEMSWLDDNSKQWVTLARCKAWAERSKANSLKSVDSAPAEVRQFLLWSLNPTFKVDKSNDTLRLTSGQVTYVIESGASTTDMDGYFRYAVLNAYKKAMIERKFLPFSELKAIAEMKALGSIPRKISVAIPGIPRSPSFEMDIRETK